MKVTARLGKDIVLLTRPLRATVLPGDRLMSSLRASWRRDHRYVDPPEDEDLELELPPQDVPWLLALAATQAKNGDEMVWYLDPEFYRRMHHAEHYIEPCKVCGAHWYKPGAESWLVAVVEQIRQAVKPHGPVPA